MTPHMDCVITGFIQWAQANYQINMENVFFYLAVIQSLENALTFFLNALLKSYR